MSNRVIEFLFANPDRTMATAGIFLALASLLLSYYLYRKSVSHRKLAIQYDSTALIDSKNGVIPAEIEIRYKGDAISDLHMWEAAVWNCGNREIRQNDFLDGHGVELVLPQDSRVLSAEILRKSNEKIGVIISKIDDDQGKIKISFRVLEPNDGFVIKILHSKKGRIDVNFPVMGLVSGQSFRKGSVPDTGMAIVGFFTAFLLIALSVSQFHRFIFLDEVTSWHIYFFTVFFSWLVSFYWFYLS